MSRSRRRFLELAGTGVGVALAGCTGEADDPAAAASATSTATDTATTSEPTTEEPQTNTPEPDPTMNAVFHFSNGIDDQAHALANVRNLLEDDSNDVEDVVLVANGAGVKLLLTEETDEAEGVKRLLDEGVSFRACRNSMDKFDAAESDLVDGVDVVPAGVGELTTLQAGDGYAYVKTP